MANVFNRKISKNVGTATTPIGSYTVPVSTKTTVIGLTIANTSGTTVTADLSLFDGVIDTFIFKNAELPVGSTTIPVGGDQKLVMITGDSLRLKSNTASSLDAILSILEMSA
jgi:hypothetical protein